MLPITITFAASLSALLFYLTHRRTKRRPRGMGRVHERPNEGGLAHGNDSTGKISAANKVATERLWQLAFAAPVRNLELQQPDIEIRDRLSALLGTGRLDAKFFPRRPTLMPQLMRAVEDSGTGAERLSRIVAHDPVLASDLLRLANSSRFRSMPQPIETIQRAITVIGVDALRGLLAIAMMRPVFRASRSNFPRFPRMLWERTERAARVAEAYAAQVSPQDRFEAQLAILLSALGPLAVYGAILDEYAQRDGLTPNTALCVALTIDWGARVARRIARQWSSSPRLAAAVDLNSEDCLSKALCVGELLGTLSLLEFHRVLGANEVQNVLDSAELGGELLDYAKPVSWSAAG